MRSGRLFDRKASLLFLLVLLPLCAAAQPYDAVLAGNEEGACWFEQMQRDTLRWVVDGVPAHQQVAAAVAAAPAGRVIAATGFAPEFRLEIVDLNGSSQSLAVLPEGWTPVSLVSDRTGGMYVLARKDGTSENAVMMFRPDGQLRAQVTIPADWNDGFDLAADQCSLLIRRRDASLVRFNACTGAVEAELTQAPDSVGRPVILSDGGFLSATWTNRIDRYSAAGELVRAYVLPGPAQLYTPALHANGLGLTDEGTTLLFASQCDWGDLWRLDLESGESEMLASVGFRRARSLVPYKAWTAAIGTSVRHRPRAIRR